MSFKMFYAFIGLSLLAGFFGSVAGSDVDVWMTTCDEKGDASTLLKKQTVEELASAKNANLRDSPTVTVSVDQTKILQSITGYGAGLPQGSASVLVSLKKRSASGYNDVMRKIFGLDSANGEAGMSIVRFPIGSCDFSLSNTSYDEVTGDYALDQFAVDSDSQMIITVLQDAVKINPHITLIASPWSPPSWLKTMDSLIALSDANTLIDDDQVYRTYAQYFERVWLAFLDAGLPLSYFTLQNEPLFGTSDQYPGMYLSADNALRLGNAIQQQMSTRGVRLSILAYDHNWDVPSYPIQVLQPQADGSPTPFCGTAWHCYGGDMATAMDQLADLYPQYPQHVTECTGSYPNSVCDVTQGMTGFGFNHEWDMQNIFLGAAAHGSSSGTKWVLALDEDCGPTLPLVTFKSGRPLVSIPSTANDLSAVYFNQDYWTMSHMSRFVPPSAVRVGSTSKSSSGSSYLTETFKVSSGDVSTMTTIAMNLDHSASFVLSVEDGDTHVTDFVVPPFSTTVVQWH